MEIKKKAALESGAQQEIILKKHVGLIHCENKLTLIQRKICNILLFSAFDKINEESIHSISLRQLCSMAGYNSNDIELIKKSLKKLISVVMEWNLLDDAKYLQTENLMPKQLSWHASALLAGASIESGQVHYSYSPQIKAVLSSLEIYGRINLFVQSKFDSSYSLVLYENCVRFKNVKKTACFSLDLFRSLMGVGKEKYPTFKEFKRNVISIAIKEINEKSDIFLEAEYKKLGRQITAIQFTVSSNSKYEPSFKKPIKTSIVHSELEKSSSLHTMLLDEFYLSEKQINTVLKEFSPEYVSQKIAFVQQKKAVKNKGAYLIAALKNDYQDVVNMSKPQTKSIQPALTTVKQPDQNAYDNKYKKYKFEYYSRLLSRMMDEGGNDLLEDFGVFIKDDAQAYSRYRKGNNESPFVVYAFIRFAEEKKKNDLPLCMEIEEFVTAAEEEIVAV